MRKGQKYTFQSVARYLLKDALITMHLKLPILMRKCLNNCTLWIPIMVHKWANYSPKMLKSRQLLVHVKFINGLLVLFILFCLKLVIGELCVQGVNGYWNMGCNWCSSPIHIYIGIYIHIDIHTYIP